MVNVIQVADLEPIKVRMERWRGPENKITKMLKVDLTGGKNGNQFDYR